MPLDTNPLPGARPHGVAEAAMRGVRGTCPRCATHGLFRKWLKPVERCRGCGFDWSERRADDFPAYVSIFITGHLLAPLMILLIGDWGWSALSAALLIIPLAIVMMMAILQPAKGAILAILWWTGPGKSDELGEDAGSDSV